MDRHRHRKASSVIIHVKIQHSPNDCRRHSTHTVASKRQTISPSSRNHTHSTRSPTSNPASALWANSRDYRIKHQKYDFFCSRYLI